MIVDETGAEPATTERVCPASMCPLIAKDGSPWTGEYAAPCPGHADMDNGGCPWWSMGCAHGGPWVQVEEALGNGGKALVLGPNAPRRGPAAPRTFDCPKAAECRWQERSGDRLCPPRDALARGLDPRVCLY